MEVDFLSVDDVLAIHEEQLAQYGGSSGVKDIGLLESAVAMPQAGFGGAYYHEDVVAMAAAYLFHIIKNHAFVDGNKRTGYVAACTFLDFNNYVVVPDDEAWISLCMGVADGTVGKEEAAGRIRSLVVHVA
jgi:death on curing protein